MRVHGDLLRARLSPPPQVKFEMSEASTLADLLQLDLHKYEDEVRNIVDKAVKESGMEKVRSVDGGVSCPR